MKKCKIYLATVVILFIAGIPAFSWETYDSIIAVVNDFSIIESEIDNKLNQVIKIQNIPKSKYIAEKSKILDKFIEDALVMQAASEEAIVVGDKRVLTQVQELMRQYYATKIKDPKKLDRQVDKMITRLEKRLSDTPTMGDKELDAQIDNFIGFLEGQFHISFKEYFEEVRAQIMREQVMSIAIGVSPPSKEEAIAWFKKNKNKLGDEVWVKQILIKPTGGSYTAERDAHQKLSDIRNRILGGEQFEALARTYSQDAESAAKGGSLGWKMLAELDPYFAGPANNVRTIGEVSQIFKTGQGYHIVKLMGRRPITFDKVERLIMYKLYNENMFTQFKKWVLKRKRESEIQIFMKNYVET